ncbi:hypothetical protein D3C78_1974070 [compost metagenome]
MKPNGSISSAKPAMPATARNGRIFGATQASDGVFPNRSCKSSAIPSANINAAMTVGM